jgi:hypothetical protein
VGAIGVGSGSAIDLTDGAIGTLSVQPASGAGAGTTTLALGGTSLNFEISGSGADQLAVTGGQASVSGNNRISITPLGTSLSPGQTYSLITAPSGLDGGGAAFQFANGLNSEVVTLGGNSYNLTLSNSAGAEKVTIGNSIATGGGPGTVGGVGAAFGNVVTPGAFNSTFLEPATQADVTQALGALAAGQINFILPGSPAQLWDLSFSGTFAGGATVTLHFDPTPAMVDGRPLSSLYIAHYTNGAWVIPPNQVIDTVADTITFTTDSFSPFILAAAPLPLLGDYNGDGVVDAADYTVWRSHLGQDFALPNRNPAASGPVSAADYNFWVSRFGNDGSEAGAASEAVPEPGTMALTVLAAVGLALFWPRRRTR